ncbi:hypothetical protein AC579_5228 [Pseudocercospora musae]|uniref:Uncharacterized protein n=1 Tax=Pseudocercospora musae TaxID=113226 RepID=A0A139IPG9_9PEZI|nr:hypothetical protein AC579_5228 [Pseudocercospora musae]
MCYQQIFQPHRHGLADVWKLVEGLDWDLMVDDSTSNALGQAGQAQQVRLEAAVGLSQSVLVLAVAVNAESELATGHSLENVDSALVIVLVHQKVSSKLGKACSTSGDVCNAGNLQTGQLRDLKCELASHAVCAPNREPFAWLWSLRLSNAAKDLISDVFGHVAGIELLGQAEEVRSSRAIPQVREVETKADAESDGGCNIGHAQCGTFLDADALWYPGDIVVCCDDVLLICCLPDIAVVGRWTKHHITLLNATAVPWGSHHDTGKVSAVDPRVAGLTEAVVRTLPVDWVESNGEHLDQDLAITFQVWDLF